MILSDLAAFGVVPLLHTIRYRICLAQRVHPHPKPVSVTFYLVSSLPIYGNFRGVYCGAISASPIFGTGASYTIPWQAAFRVPSI